MLAILYIRKNRQFTNLFDYGCIGERVFGPTHGAQSVIGRRMVMPLSGHFGNCQTQTKPMDVADGQCHETHGAQQVPLLDASASV